MKRRLTVCLWIAMLLSGASASAFTGQGDNSVRIPQTIGFRQQNFNNLSRLKTGMNRKDVSEVMGDKKNVQTYLMDKEAEILSNPHRTESLAGTGDRRFEVDYYYAYGKKRDGKITIDELCPVIFLEGILYGVGWDAYRKEIGPAPFEM